MAGAAVSATDATVAVTGGDADASADASSLRPMRVSGRYEIIGLIGQGGMGAVYRARDLELDELVALKVLKGEGLEADALARFRQEVKLARKVTHKNVARTFDIGEDERGVKFLTMELVDGESLAEHIEREGKLSVERALTIARELASGLAAAHAASVVHRDLKPANVLMARDGRIVITDFGIARAQQREQGPALTSGLIIGTPTYMAPEQLSPANPIDGRADLYALGALLFELLTGRRAWEGTHAFDVAAARLQKPPPDPRDLDPSIPRGVAELVRTCMAKEASERFANASELIAAIDALRAPTGEATPKPLSAPATRAPTREITVAVMPFRNAGAEEDAYLADGFGEEIVDALSMNRGLRVRARGAVMALDAAARTADATELGRKLGVDVLVEGSLRRSGDAVRITVRAVGVDDGFQLWAQRIDCKVGEVLAKSDEIAAAVGDALSTAPIRSARKAEADPVAIELYLRAKHASDTLWMTDPASLTLFEQAYQRAPSDPTILAGYAIALARHMPHAGRPDGLGGQLARSIAAQAIAAAPELAEPWVAEANVRLNGNDELAAIEALKEALRRSPGSADAQDLAGRLLLDMGEVDEGYDRLSRALWINPMLGQARLELVRAFAYRGDSAGIDGHLDSPEMQRDAVRQYVGKARMAIWRKLPSPPIPADLRLEARTIELMRVTHRVSASRVFDPQARAFFETLLSMLAGSSRTRRFFPQLAAELAANVDDHEATLRYIEAGVEGGLADVAWMRLPLFDRARSDARWAGLESRVAAASAALVRAWRA